MPDPSTLALFAGTAFLLIVVPGPAVLYIVSRSVEHGRLAGLVSTAGIATGALFHVAAAAVGLSSLLVSSALAFEVVKYAGAAYLVFLGLRRLLAREQPERRERRGEKRLARLFYQGVLVNLLNPKVALFFFAFLPQFVDVSGGMIAVQTLVLGLLFVMIGLLSDGVWALVAGTAGGWMKRSAGFRRSERYVAGSLFVGLGVTAALSSAAKSK